MKLTTDKTEKRILSVVFLLCDTLGKGLSCLREQAFAWQRTATGFAWI